MRKLLLLAGIALSMPLLAQQEEDVTRYIQNAGFDEDISFTVDGEMAKAAASTATTSSSVFSYAADGSIYAKNNEGHESFNGFVTVVNGWTTTYQAGKDNAVEITPENATTLKPEWVYFGSFNYGMASGSFNTGKPSNGVFATIDPPAKPEGFDTPDNTGVLQLRAGWTNSCSFKQTVNLPAARYRLEYMIYNSGIATANAKNLSNVSWRDKVVKDDTDFSDEEGLNQWVKHTMEFMTDAAFTIEFGFQAQNNVSSSQPVIWIDGIKLYKIGEASEADILVSELQEIYDELTALANEVQQQGLTGLVGEINDYQMDISDAQNEKDVEKMTQLKTEAREKIEYFKKAAAAVEGIEAVKSKIMYVINAVSESQLEAYPGFDELMAEYENLDYTEYTAEQLLGAENAAKALLVAYVKSQTAVPADFSLLIDYPWFIKYELQPVDGYYPNEGSYTQGSSNEDFTSAGWYKSGEKQDGDQRLNFSQGRSCWNAWGTSISTIGIAQDLTGLPNGRYRISADLTTQYQYRTNQHVFGKTAIATFESDYLPAEEYSNGLDYHEWTTLKADNVIVTDGTLTIGAEGAGMGNSDQSGWFLATNFRLEYLGEVDNLTPVVEAKAEELANLVENVHFGADKAKLESIADEYQTAEGTVDNLVFLLAAEVEAKNSIQKYDEVMAEGKTLPTIAMNIGTYGEAEDIVVFGYQYVMNWIESEQGTYTAIDSLLTQLKAYVNEYAEVYNEAASALVAAKGTAREVLSQMMSHQKEVLTSALQDVTTTQTYAAKLREAVASVDKQNMYDANPDMTDFTAFIINPKAEAQDGWTFNKGNGDGPIKSAGQWLDDSNAPYFDSWNSGGLKGFNYEQLVTGLPNGKYTLGVYARVTTEGAYVFYAAGDEKTLVEIPVNYYTDENEVQQVASDSRGPIWEEAVAAVTAGTATSEQQAIAEANGGIGRGWKHVEMTDIVVDNHQLLIGSAAGNNDSQTLPKDYAGNWYSTNAWTLVLTEPGDNTGWDGPMASGIESTLVSQKAADGIYSLSGVRMARMQRGLNIVVSNGKTMKVMVK